MATNLVDAKSGVTYRQAGWSVDQSD